MNDRQAKKLYKRIKKTRDDYIANKTNDYLNFTPRCISWTCLQPHILFAGCSINRLVANMVGAGGDISFKILEIHNRTNIKEIKRQAKISKPHTPTLDEKKDLFREGE